MLGGPLDLRDVEDDGVRYSSMSEEDDPQEYQMAVVNDFTYHIRDLIVDEWDIAKTNNGLKLDKFILATFFDDLIFVLISDAAKAGFALIFVWIVISIHLRSVCLSCLGIWLIVLSFPFTMFIVTGIF